MVLLRCFVVLAAFSHNLKQCGVKQIVIRFHVLSLLTNLDRIGADYFRVVNDINNKLHANAVAMQIPVGQSENFTGIIDVLTQKDGNI